MFPIFINFQNSIYGLFQYHISVLYNYIHLKLFKKFFIFHFYNYLKILLIYIFFQILKHINILSHNVLIHVAKDRYFTFSPMIYLLYGLLFAQRYNNWLFYVNLFEIKHRMNMINSNIYGHSIFHHNQAHLKNHSNLAFVFIIMISILVINHSDFYNL